MATIQIESTSPQQARALAVQMLADSAYDLRQLYWAADYEQVMDAPCVAPEVHCKTP